MSVTITMTNREAEHLSRLLAGQCDAGNCEGGNTKAEQKDFYNVEMKILKAQGKIKP